MKKFRLMKGLTCISALLAICFVFGCSSSSDDKKAPVEAYQETTQTFSVAEDGTVVVPEGQEAIVVESTAGDKKGDVKGRAIVTIPAGTKLFKADGVTPAEGNMNVELSYHESISEVTFPGGTYKNLTINGESIDEIDTTGFATYEITDEKDEQVVLGQDTPITLDIIYKEESETVLTKLLAPSSAIAANLSKCDTYYTEHTRKDVGKDDKITFTIVEKCETAIDTTICVKSRTKTQEKHTTTVTTTKTKVTAFEGCPPGGTDGTGSEGGTE
jgi:hypothetical protein